MDAMTWLLCISAVLSAFYFILVTFAIGWLGNQPPKNSAGKSNLQPAPGILQNRKRKTFRPVVKIENLQGNMIAKADCDYIRKNQTVIMAFAWKSYQEMGRGAIAIDTMYIDCGIPLQPHGLAYYPPGEFLTLEYSPAFHSVILKLIDRYDPNIGAVIVCEDEHNPRVYRISGLPSPSEAYKRLNSSR
jgi:hypothetical protein